MSPLTLYLFGPPRVERNGQPIKMGRRKAMALLAYLAVTGESHARDTLATLFWPESDQTRARTSLRITLSALRKAIGEEWLESDQESVALRREGDFRLDVDRFHKCLETCRTHHHSEEEVCPTCIDLLSEAADLYRGDFMAGFSLRDSPDFDEWQCFQTESLRRELASILEQLAQMHNACQNFESAIAHTRRWLELDALHEPAHRQLMQLYTQTGQQAAALRQYETCVQTLETEMGMPPQAETERLFQIIQKSQGAVKPPPVPFSHRYNLPYQTTSFVGREKEIIEISQMIEGATSRLVCLVGPGGIGKTRLALAVAAGRGRAFPHGVHFVPLAGVSSVDYLASVIADALDLSLSGPEEPRKQLLNYLRRKEMLLVLDNFEHLLDGAKLLSEILESAPEVKLLVTSRERLNMQGEWVIEVEGLRFPEKGEDGNIEAYSAVQLFVQSARRINANFRLEEEDRPCIVRICRLVEGMPLAIELAAAWARVLSCAEIADEIEHGLDFLNSSARDIPDRHRSMQATFDHSWDLLSEEERKAFTKLSVFRGGFDRKAAKQVAQASLVLLARLVDKSFLRWNAWSGRYELHEMLRQYAAKQLSPTLEREVRGRHCAYYMNFLGQREQALVGEGQLEALREISVEIENVRLAWQWAAKTDRRDHIEHSMESMFHFYDIGSWFREGRNAFADAAAELSQSNVLVENSNDTVCKLRVRQARFDEHIGRYREAEDLLQKGLETFRALNDPAEIAFCLIALADVALSIGPYAEAAQLMSQALPHAQVARRVDLEARINLRWGCACYRQGNYKAAQPKLERALALAPPMSRLRSDSLRRLGGLYFYSNKFSEAYTYYEQALHLCHQIGDRLGETSALVGIGNIHEERSNRMEAKNYHERALSIVREIGERQAESVVLGNLGNLLEQMGDLAIARQYYEQSLFICREVKSRWSESWVLSHLALLYHHKGDNKTSREYSQQALQVAQEFEGRFCQGFALTYLGHALAELGELAESAIAYRQAIAIRRDLGDHDLAMESLAGLARIALMQGDEPQALAYVEEILSYLQIDTLNGAEEPLRVYLTCYQVLDACQDTRAKEVLTNAHRLLQEQTSKINDEALRRSFLENVAAHREIIRLWKATTSSDRAE